jgi:hypothetical protein
MNTVNVIEILDVNNMAVQQLVAFPDNSIGNKQAEELFCQLIEENYPGVTTPDDKDSHLDDGFFWRDSYYVCIVHSTPVPVANKA